MANTSLAHTAAQPLETIAEAIEQELARLRAARPGLASRISRAAHILTTHLSCKRARTIKVRISRDGKQYFLVNGSTGGSVYVVDPSSWSCSCPDAHRHGRGCKHALACYVLKRVS
jgi:hypothetical protein